MSISAGAEALWADASFISPTLDWQRVYSDRESPESPGAITFRSRKGYMVEAHDIHVGGNYIREEITSLSMLQLSLQLKGKVIGQKGSRCGNK